MPSQHRIHGNGQYPALNLPYPIQKISRKLRDQLPNNSSPDSQTNPDSAFSSILQCQYSKLLQRDDLKERLNITPVLDHAFDTRRNREHTPRDDLKL